MSSQAPLTSPALSAFIRGVERRALVVAEFQSGEVVVAERAVAVAMRAFVPAAVNRPMAEWPSHFWGLLASTPLLRQAAMDGTWPQDLAHLAVLPEGERLALLLRIGAGLDEPTAAAVLGVEVEAYQQALALACPRDTDGHPDAQAWRALAEGVQQRVRELSPLRQEQLERLREGLVTDSVPLAPATEAVQQGDPGSELQFESQARRRRQPQRSPRSGMAQWLWLLSGAVLLAGLAWGWMEYGKRQAAQGSETTPDRGQIQPPTVDNPVKSEPLELPPPPAADPLPPEPLPEGAEASLARDADFYAWVAAGSPLPVDESGLTPKTSPAMTLTASVGH